MLMPCRECRVEISTTAEVCPHCGFQQAAWWRKKRIELKEQEEYENSEEYKNLMDKQARSEGFKNADEKRKAENKERERKEKIRWIVEDLPYQIIAALLMIGVALFCLWFAYMVIFE